MAQSSTQNIPLATPTASVFTSQEDANGKLTRFGMPMNSELEASQSAQKPEDVTFIPTAPFSAKFNGMVGTATPHYNGITFTFFDPKTKGMQSYEVSPVHVHMVQPMPTAQRVPSTQS